MVSERGLRIKICKARAGKHESAVEAELRIAQDRVNAAVNVIRMSKWHSEEARLAKGELGKAEGLLKQARKIYQRKTGIPASKLYKNRGWTYKEIGKCLKKTAA